MIRRRKKADEPAEVDALARAREAAEALKPKEAAIAWALIAQTEVLEELRDEAGRRRRRRAKGKAAAGTTADSTEEEKSDRGLRKRRRSDTK